MKDTLEIKMDLIRHHISTYNIKVTDLSQKAGYARPYVSSVLNNSRTANEGFLNHLLETLNIDYDKQIENMKLLKQLMDQFLYSLTYKDKTIKKLYNELINFSTQMEIPGPLEHKYQQCIQLYQLVNKEVLSLDLEHSQNDTFIAAMNQYNQKNYSKALKMIDSVNMKNTDASMIFYFKAFAHFNNKNFLESYSNLYKAEALILESCNYRRLFDLQILKMKVKAFQNHYEEAFLIYENVSLNHCGEDEAIEDLNNDWFACLVLMKKYKQAFELRSHIKNLKQENIVILNYAMILHKEKPETINLENTYDHNFMKLINLCENKEPSLLEIDELYHFFKDLKHPNLFLDFISNKIFIKLYKNKRSYKRVVEIQDKMKGLC